MSETVATEASGVINKVALDGARELVGLFALILSKSFTSKLPLEALRGQLLALSTKVLKIGQAAASLRPVDQCRILFYNTGFQVKKGV